MSNTQPDIKKRLRLVRRKSSKKLHRNLQRYGLISLNVITVMVVAAFLINSRPSKQLAQGQSAIKRTDVSQKVVSLDQVSAADIAVNVAVAARLPELDQVRNQADSKAALISISVPDEVVIAKPQIITTNEAGAQSRKDIIKHTVADGETVTSIAQTYNVSTDSIKGSNGLAGDTVPAGRELVLPPKNRSGIIYKVASGDTLEKLADKYKTSTDKITKFNDLELATSLPVDEYIFLPDGEKPPEPVIINTAASPSSTFTPYIATYTPLITAGNGYSFGWCTYWSAGRRIETGNPIPSNWGNANTWDDYARAAGYLVDNNPTVGSIFQTDGYGHSIYHVAYVEAVNADGSVLISEMNYRGWNVSSTRLISATEAPKYNYIH